jgi:hypothetical protein
MTPRPVGEPPWHDEMPAFGVRRPRLHVAAARWVAFACARPWDGMACPMRCVAPRRHDVLPARPPVGRMDRTAGMLRHRPHTARTPTRDRLHDLRAEGALP